MSSKDRLNTEMPNDQLSDLLNDLRSRMTVLSDDDTLPTGLGHLSKDFPRGKMVITGITGFDQGRLTLSWMAALRRIAAEGSPVISPWPVGDGIPSTRCEVLKGRSIEDEHAPRFALDYSAPIELRVLDWIPCRYEQANDRLRRKVYLNVTRRASSQASRNEREGVYGFKVKGRHRRKKQVPKIEVMGMNASVLERIKEQVCK